MVAVSANATPASRDGAPPAAEAPQRIEQPQLPLVQWHPPRACSAAQLHAALTGVPTQRVCT
eukprot:4198455-Amphidinium_carterae.1